MSGSSSLRIVEGRPDLLPTVLELARRTYATHAHQCQPRYHTWLYERAPQGLASMLVVVDEQERAVGMVNRMFMDWTVSGEQVKFPTLIDLALDPAQRQSGAGLRLILRAAKDVPHAFVNGSNSNSAPIFRSLRYQELSGGHWSRLALRPAAALWWTVRHRMDLRGPRPLDSAAFASTGAVRCTALPSTELLTELAAAANAVEAPVRPHWDLGSLQWRFFHPEGPRHVLFHQHDERGALRGALVLSIGTRQGLNIVRPVLVVTPDPSNTKELLQCAVRVATRAGAHGMVSYAHSPALITALKALGFKSRTDAPATFFHHKRREGTAPFLDAHLPPAVSDIGFDAFPRS